MKTQVMCIRDEKLGAFGQPFTVASVGQGARSFDDAINNPEKNTDIARHPEDFSLWVLGVYDDETGLFEQDKPQHIAKGTKHV